jgi:hypothetical protein
MAGAGWKTYSTGDLIDATTFQTFIQDQVIQVYADSSARDTALGTNDAEGMFCFLKDTNTLQFYDGSAWTNFIGDGDITAVTITTSATSGLSGGSTATSGAFTSTLTVDPSQLTDGTGITVDVANDLLILEDATDNTVKKVNPNQIASGGGTSIGLILALG